MLTLHYTCVFVVTLLACPRVDSTLTFTKELKKSCSALTSEGTVDLTSLAITNGKSAAFTASSTMPGQGVTYWNPCIDTTVANATTPCKDFGEVFQLTTGFVTCSTLSAKKDANFSVKNGDLILNYASPVLNSPSHITLKCSTTTPSSPFVQGMCQATPTDNCFTFTHPACCPVSSGLSFGSILLIIVLVLAVCYVIFGVIFMKFVKKAEGAEVFPNVSFWKSLPVLTKDGVIFVLKCGKAPQSGYEDI